VEKKSGNALGGCKTDGEETRRSIRAGYLKINGKGVTGVRLRGLCKLGGRDTKLVRQT